MTEERPGIPYVRPSITEVEIEAVTEAARAGWGPRCYDEINRFEAEFAAHLGVRHAVATSSCTGALHMGFAALDLKPGDEVILADTNWIASPAPIVHLGATPVFVDIRPDTWCLDPEAVERAITPRTRAILAVHLYGNLCDMDRLQTLADQHAIALVEDAAEALGSVYDGRRAGSLGCFGAFSFHGSKTLTTGEGGMFVTNDDALYEAVHTLSNHGRARGQTKQFWADMVGFKYKMSNLAAALGRVQLARIDELVAKKRWILEQYRERFAPYPQLSINPDFGPARASGAWMPNVVLDESLGVHRDAVIARLKEENVDARVFFHPLSSLPMFEAAPQNVNAYSLSQRALNLPSYHDMIEDEIDRIARIVIQFAGGHP